MSDASAVTAAQSQSALLAELMSASVTTAEIETYPMPLASGKTLAVMSATALRPQGVALWPTDANAPASREKVIYPTLTKDFPMGAQVVPTNVTLTAADGMKFNNQIFVPKDIKPGEKRPAIVFVHGGPSRQMLLGYQYLSFYHVFYAVNQWLQSQGYVVPDAFTHGSSAQMSCPAEARHRST